MIAELVAVGTEILLGNIVNTNSAYLSEKCAQLGLSVYYESVRMILRYRTIFVQHSIQVIQHVL